jgi:hypothetical protein
MTLILQNCSPNVATQIIPIDNLLRNLPFCIPVVSKSSRGLSTLAIPALLFFFADGAGAAVLKADDEG